MGRKAKAKAGSDASEPGRKAPQTGIRPLYVGIGIAVCVLSVLAASRMQKHDTTPSGGVDAANSTSDVAARDTARDDRPLSTRVWWMAPFFSGGGYSSEAVAFAVALSNSPAIRSGGLWISQHGDGFLKGVMQTMDRAALGTLSQLMSHVQPGLVSGPTIVVCHSGPLAWAVPEPAFQTAPCPPAGLQSTTSGHQSAVYTVGRTMFETDRLPAEYVRRCNAMNEIWVPTEWSKEVFRSAGVTAPIQVVPEPVDVAFFSPEGVDPLPLPAGRLVFGQPLDQGHAHTDFLSIFKWEERKAWDVLLAAYLEEFTSNEGRPVAIYLLTQPYHSSADFAAKMHAWASESLGVPGEAERRQLPSVYVISGFISDRDLRRLYRAADAFVSPSRGEGWGRPHAEAMSMGLPVIATNWSGPAAFMDEGNSYPLAITGLAPVAAGPFAGHRWAAPSVTHLKQLLRRVVDHPEEAAERGRRARERMVRDYAPAVVAELVVQRLRAVEARLNETAGLLQRQ